MTRDASSSFNVLADLQKRFLERSRAECERLSALLAVPAAEQNLQEAIAIAHRLAGGGGTFALPGISDAALCLEESLRTSTNPRSRLAALEAAITDAERHSAPPAHACTDAISC